MKKTMYKIIICVLTVLVLHNATVWKERNGRVCSRKYENGKGKQ